MKPIEPNEQIGREIICQEREDLLVAPGYHRSSGFRIQRTRGQIVWSTFDMDCTKTEDIPGLLFLFDGQTFAQPLFREPADVEPGNLLRVTYTLSWNWRYLKGGGGKGKSGPHRTPHHRLPLVPTLAEWKHLTFSANI